MSSWFNISLEAQNDAVSTFLNNDKIVSWRPHPQLPDGIRNPLVEAVGRMPRAWLMPPKTGEIFDTYQAGQARVLGLFVTNRSYHGTIR